MAFTFSLFPFILFFFSLCRFISVHMVCYLSELNAIVFRSSLMLVTIVVFLFLHQQKKKKKQQQQHSIVSKWIVVWFTFVAEISFISNFFFLLLLFFCSNLANFPWQSNAYPLKSLFIFQYSGWVFSFSSSLCNNNNNMLFTRHSHNATKLTKTKIRIRFSLPDSTYLYWPFSCCDFFLFLFWSSFVCFFLLLLLVLPSAKRMIFGDFVSVSRFRFEPKKQIIYVWQLMSEMMLCHILYVVQWFQMNEKRMWEKPFSSFIRSFGWAYSYTNA